eukprot:g23260.t1
MRMTGMRTSWWKFNRPKAETGQPISGAKAPEKGIVSNQVPKGHSDSLVKAITSEGKASRWREALDLLPRDETSVDFWSFSAAIGACSGGSAWPISLALLKRVQQEVPAGELTPVYGGAVSSRAPWHVGLALLAQMETERVPANIIIYSALMSACNRAQQWQVSLQLFQAAERHHFSLDVMAFGAGITAAEKGQQWQSALVLLDQMKEEELLPNLITCNAAIAACGPASPFALELLRALGPRADAVSFESAVTACGRDQAWMTCLSLLEEMEDRGLRRSVIAFGGAIAGQEGHWPHALALLEQMSISKVVTNVIVYSALSSVCSSSSQWQMALQVFEEMQLSLVRGNVVAYSAAISACEKGQQWLKALDFLDEMLRCRVVPNVVTTSSLLASLAGRWELAMLLLMQLPSRACTDVAVYNAAASVCGQAGEIPSESVRGFRTASRQKTRGLVHWSLPALPLFRLPPDASPVHLVRTTEGMDELQIDMDVITYSTAMGAMEEGLQWQKALQLLEFAVEAQLELDQMIDTCEDGYLLQTRKRVTNVSNSSNATIRPPNAQVQATYAGLNFALNQSKDFVARKLGRSPRGPREVLEEDCCCSFDPGTNREPGIHNLTAAGTLHVTAPESTGAIEVTAGGTFRLGLSTAVVNGSLSVGVMKLSALRVDLDKSVSIGCVEWTVWNSIPCGIISALHGQVPGWLVDSLIYWFQSTIEETLKGIVEKFPMALRNRPPCLQVAFSLLGISHSTEVKSASLEALAENTCENGPKFPVPGLILPEIINTSMFSLSVSGSVPNSIIDVLHDSRALKHTVYPKDWMGKQRDMGKLRETDWRWS